jgi:hypothetical protein
VFRQVSKLNNNLQARYQRFKKPMSLQLIILMTLIHSSACFAQISFNAGGVNGGAVVVGASTTTCNASAQGGLRWSATNSCIEICNGTLWNCTQLTVCGTILPTSFTFTNQSGVTVSTLTTSNIVQVTGLAACTVQVSVSGAGSPQFRVCNDSSCTAVTQDWTSSASTLVNNQYVQLRLTSYASGNMTNTASLAVGARSVGWTVTTAGNCTDPTPAIGTFCADGTVYVGLSPDGSVKMYATPCNYGRAWNGSVCSGSAIGVKWSEAGTVATGVTNATTGEANTATLAGLSNADSPYSAAQICQNMSFGGQSDWYLPSTGEVSVLQAACGVTTDLPCSYFQFFHSSREYSTTSNWVWRTDWSSITLCSQRLK